MRLGSILLLVVIQSPSVTADFPPYVNNSAYSKGEYGAYPTQRFYSDPDVIAPIPNVIKQLPFAGQTKNYFTWAAHGDNITAVGPQLLDANTLSVTYQAPTYGEDTFGLSVQTCNGTNYLIWWAGTNIDGRAGGRYYLLNSTYDLVWNVSSIGLEWADAHDIYLTPDCHAVFTSYQPKPFELDEFDGLTDNSWLLDSYFQEIDLATNELLFQWRASDHVDIHDSYWLPEIEQQGDLKWHGWDFFHINSVEKDRKGNFLISARHTNAIYYINGVTGAVIWILGGKKSMFTPIDDHNLTKFSWQHDARWTDKQEDTILLFDDRSCGYLQEADPVSRGIVLALSFQRMTVELLEEYRAPDGIVSMRKGGMHRLDNGNTVLGFGSEPAFTEYSEQGQILQDFRFGPVMQDIDRATADNYRTYRVSWVGTPSWSPKIAIGPSTRLGDLGDTANDTIYFSWNGATEVTQWIVFASVNEMELIDEDHILTRVDKTGFEDSVPMPNASRYFCAVAIDAYDTILGITAVLDVQDGQQLDDSEGSFQAQLEEFSRSMNSSTQSKWLLFGIVCGGILLLGMIFTVALWYFGYWNLRYLGARLMRIRGYQAVSEGEEKGTGDGLVVNGDYSDSSAVDFKPTMIPRHSISLEQDIHGSKSLQIQ